MVDFIIFSKSPEDLFRLKNIIKNLLKDQEHTLEEFIYVMDMMDYIYATHPEKFVVFYYEKDSQSGVEIAQKIYDLNNKGRFCLLSDCNPDNVELLFYSGVSYYINPETQNSFERCISRFNEYYDDSFRRFLSLKNQTGTHTIPLHKIEYIMSDKRKIVVFEKEKHTEFYYKLDDIEPMTEGIFLRCHQSYLVNMKKIKAFVEDGLIMSSDQFIPVSRKKYFQAKKIYLSYVAGSDHIVF